MPKISKQLQLYFLGFFTLFFELLLIRYLSGSIWNLGYFPNLILIAVFIGMGAGFLFQRYISDEQSDKLLACGVAIISTLVILLTYIHPAMPGFQSSLGTIQNELYFTALPANATNHLLQSYGLLLFVFLAVIAFFFFVSQVTAKLFRCFSPLHSYSLDIMGSISGILLFIGISFLQLPAYSWMLIACAVFCGAFSPKRFTLKLAGVGCLLVAAFFIYWQNSHYIFSTPRSDLALKQAEVIWSPYQKVEYFQDTNDAKNIAVNGILHQGMLKKEEMKVEFYQLPYFDRKRRGQEKYRRVLIIGAGSGNDVAMALANGAEYVDAVEIDPSIAVLGKKYHPDQPFSDSRVHLTIDDGRAFMSQSVQKYDLIIFALTDSLVKVSAVSQLRLENYLYTVESMARAMSLLNPNGDLILYNNYRAEWLVTKLQMMLHEASGRDAHILYDTNNFSVLKIASREAVDFSRAQDLSIELATDNWPFLYLKGNSIPTFYYLALSILFLIVCGLLWFAHRSFVRVGENVSRLGIRMAFLLMGVAFLLLETKSVIQFSLLFGTTWLNSSLVFLAILVFVLLANWVATYLNKSHIKIFYGLLLIACVLESFYPIASLLSISAVWLRFFVASVMTFSPIFFANIIFSLFFREEKLAEHLFGWNLIGATLGGAVEYSSMIIGYEALSVIVATLYSVVFLLFYFSSESAASKLRNA